jgi:3-oxoacyl-(acyl-carrier-protein) synthase
MTQTNVFIKAYTALSTLGYQPKTIQESIEKNEHTRSSFLGRPFIVLHPECETFLETFLLENPNYQKLDRSVQLVLAAGELLRREHNIPQLSGINISSSRGASNLWEEQYNRFLNDQNISVFTSPNTTLGNVSSHLSNHLNTQHIAISHSITCSSSLHSLTNAFAWLKSGMANSFIAGGTESCISEFSLKMFDNLKIYSKKEGNFPCRPFEENKEKNSMVLGEGAATFLLDSEKENALAQIEGVGFYTEGFKHPADISSDGKGYLESMKMACQGIDPKEVDLILMHAPGTIKGDLAEDFACQQFDDSIPRFSTKYLFGHCLGAAGGLNIAYALELFKKQTITLSYPYKSTFQDKKLHQPKRILINTSGFGGNTVSVLLKKVDGNM